MPSPRLKHFYGQVFRDRSASDTDLIVAASPTVDVYRLGGHTADSGTILSGAGGNISMAEVGSIRVGDVIFNGTVTTITGTVNTITGAGPYTVNITAAGGSFVWAIADRLTPLSTRPTLYKDAGKQTAYASSQISGSTRGFWEFWAALEGCDYIESGAGFTTTKRATAGEIGNFLLSTEKDTAGLGAFKSDTAETWSLGNLWEWFNNGVRKAYITSVGFLRAVGADLTGGTTTIDTLVVNIGSTLPAGDIITADMAANAVHRTVTTYATVAADLTSSGAEQSLLAGGAQTYTALAGNQGAWFSFEANFNNTANAAAMGVEVRLKIGGVIKFTALISGNLTTAQGYHPVAFRHFEPTVAAGGVAVDVVFIEVGGATPIEICLGTTAAYRGHLQVEEVLK